MEVNNLSDPVESDKLKTRFYLGRDQAASEVVYRDKPAQGLAQGLAQEGLAQGAKEEVLRGLWRDRLFDRQTELLQKHVEFSQRQQTELCEAIKAAWSAKEAEVTLDRGILLKLLEAKSAESQQQTKSIIDKIQAQQTSTSFSANLEIDTAIQPVKSELKALQFQLQRLTDTQLYSPAASAPAPAPSASAIPAAPRTADLDFYAKLRVELSEISQQIAACTWVSRKPRKIDAKPPTNFTLRVFGEAPAKPKISQKSPGAANNPKKTLASAQPLRNDTAKTATLRRQARQAPPRLSATLPFSPDRPRSPPKQLALTPGAPPTKKPVTRTFDMQTSTEGAGVEPLKRNPQDYVSIDDLFIDIPGFFTGAPSSMRRSPRPELAVEAQTGKTVLTSPERNLKFAVDLNNLKTVITSPSPVPIAPAIGVARRAGPSAEVDEIYSSVSDGRSAGELSLSSGQVSDNSLSYW